MFERLHCDLKLRIKKDWQVFPVESRGLNFVGYVFKSNSTRLRKSIAKGFKSKTRAVKRVSMGQPQAIGGLMSYWGWVKHANAKKLWLSHVDATVIRITDRYETKRNPLKKVMK